MMHEDTTPSGPGHSILLVIFHVIQYSSIKTFYWGSGCGSVVEHLPSMSRPWPPPAPQKKKKKDHKNFMHAL
jgi:hypothetical protein